MPFRPEAFRLSSGLAAKLELDTGDQVAKALRFADANPDRAREAISSLDSAVSPAQERRRRKMLRREITG